MAGGGKYKDFILPTEYPFCTAEGSLGIRHLYLDDPTARRSDELEDSITPALLDSVHRRLDQPEPL